MVEVILLTAFGKKIRWSANYKKNGASAYFLEGVKNDKKYLFYTK